MSGGFGRDGWAMIVGLGAVVFAAVGGGAALGAEPEPPPWQRLFAEEAWYKQTEGEEQTFRGRLEAVPQAGGFSTLMRTSYYRLGDRTIYTGARRLPALDRLVGRAVEIRGKAVDMELSGQALKEIWPAAIRPLPGEAAPEAPAVPRPLPRPEFRPPLPAPEARPPIAVEPLPVQPLPGIEARPAPAGPPRGNDDLNVWAEADLVFLGKLREVVAGPVGLSSPPMYTHRLSFVVERPLRGKLEAGVQVQGTHVARQELEPVFPLGQLCLVAVRGTGDRGRIEAVAKAEDALVERVALICKLPFGWKLVDGKPVSPWAGLGAKAWPAAAALTAEVKCSQSGRPALMAGSGIVFDVEPVPPKKEIQWTNPDGDGEYRITVTNAGDQPVEVPALLSHGETILWKNSLVILCQGRAYPVPGLAELPDDVKPTRLAPGQSVSTVVQALALDGPEWPRGGYRIEFQFCLGELIQTKSFYYMSRHHDAIRAQLGK